MSDHRIESWLWKDSRVLKNVLHQTPTERRNIISSDAQMVKHLKPHLYLSQFIIYLIHSPKMNVNVSARYPKMVEKKCLYSLVSQTITIDIKLLLFSLLWSFWVKVEDAWGLSVDLKYLEHDKILTHISEN